MVKPIETTFLFIVALVTMGYATVTLGSQCPSTNAITNPAAFQWTYHPVTSNNPEAYYSGTLEFGEATFNIGSETLTTRAYRQAGSNYSIPAPTLNMQPGNKYVLRFKNLLPYEPLVHEENVFKDPNVSNLHTHGLHISGESPGYDVTRFFEGGFGGDFVYDIPPDHMGGTYWLHSHHHGSTFLQVSGGSFGLILIDDSNDGMPDNVANMTERHLVIGFLDPTAAGTGGDTIMGGTMKEGAWTVNGIVSGDGNLCMPPDTWQHFRILLADRDAKSKNVSAGSECEVAMLARDGVWRTVAPRNLTTDPLPDVGTNAVQLNGASRVDLAVRCSGDSVIKVKDETVANIYVDGTSNSSVHPYAEDGSSTWSATRATYLRDLRKVKSVNTEIVNLGARTINGEKFDKDVPTFTLNADATQEWTIKGSNKHPWHQHIYHSQIITKCPGFEEGEFYDVIDAQGNCVVRFDLNTATSTVFEGRTIMHCHILEHEDLGAMGFTDVVGGRPPPTFPVNGDINPGYSEYYLLN